MSDDKLWVEDIIPDVYMQNGDTLEMLSDLCKEIQVSVDRGSWKDVTILMTDGNFLNGKWIEGEGLYFMGWRKETEKEYDKRIKKENDDKKRAEKNKKLKEENERKQYERLKKKFEGKNAT